MQYILLIRVVRLRSLIVFTLLKQECLKMRGIVIKSIFLMMTMKDVSSNLWIVISFFLWDMGVILNSMELVLKMVK